MRRMIPKYNLEDHDAGGIINLTPLLDVLFVVLILFILIAPLLNLDRITLSPGSLKAAEFTSLNNARPIKIYVQSDNSIFLGKHLVSLQELSGALDELYKMYPYEVPELYQDRYAFFGTYNQIKNVVERAGFEHLDVVLKNE